MRLTAFQEGRNVREICRFFTLVGLVLSIGRAVPAVAQLNQNCTVTVLNRTVSVNADGSWVLPNIPANFGQVKARATCIQNGVTTFGESPFFSVSPNGAVNLPTIPMGTSTPIAVSLAISQPSSLTTMGQTAQLGVTATYPDGTTKDVSTANAGTNYTISNSAIATISADGLVTAVSSGTVVIQANNDGATGIISVPIVLGGASHGGIPDSWAIAHGLNPADPLMPSEDPDRDGLTNLQEFQIGTDPNNPDTDGDGLSDGDEVSRYHTNPLLSDTDGDRIPDGVEIQTGTDPNDPKSYDLKKAVASSTLTPPSFALTTSIANPQLSVQLSWKVLLIDGKTTLDLTADSRTTYSSSDLSICGFGGRPGLVFSGSSGSCVITLRQNTLTVTVPGTVSSFTPMEIATLSINGAVAVDVGGNFAYVAAGPNGLVVVDVSDRTSPRIRGTLAGLGDAEAVRTFGQFVVLADATGFLRIVQTQNPDSPVLLSTIAVPGTPTALAVHGNLVAVAAGSGGLSLVNTALPSTPSLLATLATPSPAVGVDFDPQHGVAVVAMSTSGLQMVDISTPTSPGLLGLLPGGDVRRVLMRYPVVLLADAQRSVTSVDATNPNKPILSTSLATNLGGVPIDIAAFGNIAMTADITFGRAVPIINISSPLSPISLGFWTLLSPGYSSSVAVDLAFGYLIVPNTLRILKYQNIVDSFGIAPTISLTSPVGGSSLIQGQTVTVSANAADDVAVASVTFLVNGQPVLTTSSQPYQLLYTVPETATAITFDATAVDYGGNIGAAASVTVSVIPDPLTTIVGRTVDKSGNPISGADVTASTLSVKSGTDGSFSISGLPTILGNLLVHASASESGIKLFAQSSPLAPVPGGIVQAGNLVLAPAPQVMLTSPANGDSNVAAGATISALFNIAVTAASVNQQSFILTDYTAGSTVPGTVQLDTAGITATFVPSQPLPLNHFFAATLTTAITAQTSGNPLPQAFGFGFSTSPISRELDSPTFSILNATPATQPATLIGEIYSPTFSVLNGPSPTLPALAMGEIDSPTFSVSNRALATLPATLTGEIDSPTFSILNGPSPILPALAMGEIDSPTFSVLNRASATLPASLTGEIDSPTFSVLNGLTGTLPALAMGEIDSPTFSLINGTAAPASNTGEVDSPTFSVVNSAKNVAGAAKPSDGTKQSRTVATNGLVPSAPVVSRGTDSVLTPARNALADGPKEVGESPRAQSHDSPPTEALSTHPSVRRSSLSFRLLFHHLFPSRIPFRTSAALRLSGARVRSAAMTHPDPGIHSNTVSTDSDQLQTTSGQPDLNHPAPASR